MINYDSIKYIQKKCKVAKGVLDMFPDGKWQNSALMKSFKMIWRTFYIVRYCATLWRGDLIWKGHRWRFRGVWFFRRLSKNVKVKKTSNNVKKSHLHGWRGSIRIVKSIWTNPVSAHNLFPGAQIIKKNKKTNI